MKKIVFVVNVDYFFESHRRQLQEKLSEQFATSIVAGHSGKILSDDIDGFDVKSRIPSLRGLYQLKRKLRRKYNDSLPIVVTPVMIFIVHFLITNHGLAYYNFSGLGFLRSMPRFASNLILWTLKLSRFKGKRILVVQNSDDRNYLSSAFNGDNRFELAVIPGSGFKDKHITLTAVHSQRVTIGYAGRIRKDKGILDLIRAVSELRDAGCDLELVIWGKLDDNNRHGFNKSELDFLKKQSHFFKGHTENTVEMFSSFNWFCLPSNGEGLSKSAIEASCFGLPLVMSNVPGNRDMVSGNGYLFEYGNVSSLKLVLKGLIGINPQEYLALSRNSRKMYEATWTMETISHQWIQLINAYDTTSSK